MRLVIIVPIAAMVVATSAGAQFTQTPTHDPAYRRDPLWGTSRGPGPGPGSDVGEDIKRERKAGLLTRSEARHLSNENADIGVLADRYSVGGLSESEQGELDFRNAVLSDEVHNRPFQTTVHAKQ